MQLLEISRFQFDPHPDYSIILTLIQFSIEFSIQFHRGARPRRTEGLAVDGAEARGAVEVLERELHRGGRLAHGS